MKILFIGGTKFVGRRMVEDAISLGHEVHLLQRGKTNLDLFPKVKKYIGDRSNISKILPKNEQFDLVVDSCGFHPEVVKESCLYLKNKTKLYAFISTCSVYADFSIKGLNEDSSTSVLSILPSMNDPISNENYGPLKALCEQVVINIFGINNSLIIRPCIIVGAQDESKRFDTWIANIINHKLLEVPNDLDSNIQFIDVRAISDFVLNAYDKKTSGIFNLVGPKDPIKFLDFINMAKNLLNPNLEIKLVDSNSKSFPMYVKDENWKGFFSFDGAKAYNTGFKGILPEDTIKYVGEFLKGIN
jgi:2'-hydroxyisoflavone reductase